MDTLDGILILWNLLWSRKTSIKMSINWLLEWEFNEKGKVCLIVSVDQREYKACVPFECILKKGA